jgi:hypothetical protein
MEQFLCRHAQDFLVVGANQQRRMLKEPTTAAIAGGSQPLDLSVNAKLQFGRVANRQTVPRRAGESSSPMAFGQCLERHAVGVEQAIRCLAIAPAVGLLRRGAAGMGRNLRRQRDCTFRSTRIAQLTISKLFFGTSVPRGLPVSIPGNKQALLILGTTAKILGGATSFL